MSETLTYDPLNPTTLDEACRKFISIIAVNSETPDEMQSLVSGKDAFVQLERSCGRAMRNDWGLWQYSPLARWFYSIGIYHPDDMSSIVIKKTMALVKNEAFDLDAHVAYYLEYWAAEGETQEVMRQRVIDGLAKNGLPGLDDSVGT